MKFLLGLIATLMIATSIAIPVNNPNDDVENVEVAYPQRNVEDVEPVYTPFLVPISISPYSFFDGFEDYFRTIRERLLGRFLEAADTFELDPSKANSTSETKIINGHRVEINNTVYVDKDENGNEIVKVRVVHIRPLDLEDDSTTISSINSDINNNGDDDDGEKTVKPKAEGTTAEPEFNNEIDSPKNSTANYTETETEPIINLLQDEISDISDNENVKYKISKKDIQPLYYETIPTESLAGDQQPDIDSITYITTLKNDDNIENEFINHNDDATVNDYNIINIKNLSNDSINVAGENDNNDENIEETNKNIKGDMDYTEANVNSKYNSNDDNDDNDDTDDTDDDDDMDIDDDDNDADDDDDAKNDNDNTETNENTESNENESDMVTTIINNESNDEENINSNDNLDKKENYYHRSRENFYSSEEEEHSNNNKYDNIKYETLNNEWYLTPEDYNNDKDNNYDNDIDTYESIPIDLSNDINVNYIAQKNGVKIDPDAEIFTQNNYNNYYDDDDIKSFDIEQQSPSFYEESLEESIHNNNGNDNSNENESNDNISERKIPIK
ncbi:putative uncharacterized protein DDB_G0282499 [Condylostylus longicornis]|uniref:putative uncharacterized protein DDB_G0282499 n=1 Tax=Condylostylus longicornis TaxID=2530218 RepID=UPI00244DF26D|nr:putative uncharacterized protein DDB_G0282499 [Condylostylus longicornis]XP_055387255.1 putative uncharacterized protein DDB_G0282499 [Condylostylus longicornis]